jgi:hypothetical protein
MSDTLPAAPSPSPARTVLAHVSGWTFAVLESSLLNRECVHLSSAPKLSALIPLALTLRPDLLVLEWGNSGRLALERVQAHNVTARLRVAMAAPPVTTAKLPSGLLHLPAHEPDEWDRLLGEWLDIPHRSESRTAVSLGVTLRNVAGPQTQPGVILDLSRNGALIRTDAMIAARTVLALRFNVPGAHAIECLAVVRRHAWDDHGHFHGVRFIEVSAHDAHAIGSFLRTARGEPGLSAPQA